jgi:alpha-beta hydrolase superfamily lysophospholipase
MRARVVKVIKITAVAAVAVFLTFIGVRMYDSQRGLPLERWHIYAPKELSLEQLDASDWQRYLAAEATIFDNVRKEVSQKQSSDKRVAFNRYFEGSPVYPSRFAQDFNRSFILEPAGEPAGAVVLLHGLTDSPYSQRHIAALYRDHGFVAIVPRLPAHGTVPAALADVSWEEWVAATRLAVREARRRTGPNKPLHLVGFSNGGALALIYALDALGDSNLARPDRIVLLSPMVGITPFARFAGLAGLPAYLPHFAKAAWLGVVPEFNPFKYNSFPVNGARQTHLLTRVLQDRLSRYARDGKLDQLAPVLTFQSVMDFTVSTRAVLTALYANLPANGSEIVLFDVNRTVKFGPLLRSGADNALARVLPKGPQRFRITMITNSDEEHGNVVERVIEAGTTSERSRPLDLSYPDGLYSLSHVAIPFPVNDGLYGANPDKSDDFGLKLGTLAPRGERNVLIASLDSLLRASSNPFFPYVKDRIAEGISGSPPSITQPAAGVTTKQGAN